MRAEPLGGHPDVFGFARGSEPASVALGQVVPMTAAADERGRELGRDRHLIPPNDRFARMVAQRRIAESRGARSWQNS